MGSLTTTGYASLEALVSSASGEAYLQSSVVLGSDLTLPSTIRLNVLKGGSIDLDGHTLTLSSLNAGKYQIFTGTGTVILPSHSVSVIYPEWWGTDQTALQAAIVAGSYAGIPVDLGDDGTTWTLTSVLTLYSYTHLIGKGATIDSSSFTSQAILAQGSLGDTEDVASDVSEGDYEITITANDAGFAADDWVLLKSNDVLTSGDQINTAKSGEFKRIRSVTGTAPTITVRFVDPIYDPYTTTNSAQLQKVSWLTNLTIEGITFQGPNTQTGAAYGIRMILCKDFKVKNCKFLGYEIYSSSVEMSIIGELDGNYYDGVLYTGDCTVNSGRNDLYFKKDGGTSTLVTIPDGLYTWSALATAIQSAIDTAFSISSTVSYSASTYKFTISVPSGTIQYISTGSDLGVAIGFTTSSSAASSITSDTANSGSIFYAIPIVDSSQWINVHHNFATRMRHLAVTVSFSYGVSGRYGEPRFCDINHNQFYDSMAGNNVSSTHYESYAYENHGKGRWISWCNNFASGAYSGMHIDGGRDIIVKDNTFVNMEVHGISLCDSNTEYVKNVLISGNYIGKQAIDELSARDCSGIGEVFAYSGSAKTITNVDISTPTAVVITTSTSHGYSNSDQVEIYDITGTTQLNNRIFNITKGFSISAATKANPCKVTTSSAHIFANGDSVIISGVAGMTEINGTFTITVVDSTSFTLGVDSTSYRTYTSGGTCYVATKFRLDDLDATGYTAYTSGGSCIDLNGDVGSTVLYENVVIENNQILGWVRDSYNYGGAYPGAFGIYFGNNIRTKSGCIIRNNIINSLTSGQSSTGGYGIALVGTGDWDVSGNNIINHKQGIYTNNAARTGTFNIIRNNVIEYTTQAASGYGVYMNGFGAIKENYFKRCRTPVYIDTSSSEVALSGNVYHDCYAAITDNGTNTRNTTAELTGLDIETSP